MVIDIRQQFIPIVTTLCEWEMCPFERTVCLYDGLYYTVSAIGTPNGYVAGMLRAYVDGVRVDYHDLDVALATIHQTRDTVDAAIYAAMPRRW